MIKTDFIKLMEELDLTNNMKEDFEENTAYQERLEEVVDYWFHIGVNYFKPSLEKLQKELYNKIEASLLEWNYALDDEGFDIDHGQREVELIMSTPQRVNKNKLDEILLEIEYELNTFEMLFNYNKVFDVEWNENKTIFKVSLTFFADCYEEKEVIEAAKDYLQARAEADEEQFDESLSQEIGDAYRTLDAKYGLDFNELIYGPEGFMETNYPAGFEDFNGDIIYSKKYWDEFVEWLKVTKNLDLVQAEKDSLLIEDVDLEREPWKTSNSRPDLDFSDLIYEYEVELDEDDLEGLDLDYVEEEEYGPIADGLPMDAPLTFKNVTTHYIPERYVYYIEDISADDMLKYLCLDLHKKAEDITQEDIDMLAKNIRFTNTEASQDLDDYLKELYYDKAIEEAKTNWREIKFREEEYNPEPDYDSMYDDQF